MCCAGLEVVPLCRPRKRIRPNQIDRLTKHCWTLYIYIESLMCRCAFLCIVILARNIDVKMSHWSPLGHHRLALNVDHRTERFIYHSVLM